MVLESKEQKMLQLFTKSNFRNFFAQKYFAILVVVFVVLLSLHTYALSATGIIPQPLQKTDLVPIDGWESNVFDVINYLNSAEKGNVVALQAQSIPFFTNRTSFELFDYHTFVSLSPLLQIENSTLFKQKISELNIRYFVLPNEKSPLVDKLQRMSQSYKAIKIIENDKDFVRLNFTAYNVYKFTGTYNNHEFQNEITPKIYMQDTAVTDGYGTYSSLQINSEFVSPSSVLVGKNIDTIILDLKKTGSPTGTATIGVFNTDLSVKKLFASIDVSALGTIYSGHPFSLPSGQSYIIQSSDRIGIEYAGGDSSNFVATTVDGKNRFDGTNSYYSFYANSWKSLPASDLTMTLKLVNYTRDVPLLP
jgi:hypothetical protein